MIKLPMCQRIRPLLLEPTMSHGTILNHETSKKKEQLSLLVTEKPLIFILIILIRWLTFNTVSKP